METNCSKEEQKNNCNVGAGGLCLVLMLQ